MSQIDQSFDDAGKLTSDRTRESLTKFMNAFASWVDMHAAHANATGAQVGVSETELLGLVTRVTLKPRAASSATTPRGPLR